MFRHNLLITYRSFLRDKSTFLINLIGLSTGLACVLLIYLWVNDEMSIDKFNEKDSQLYLVMINLTIPQEVLTWDTTPLPLAEALMEEMPEVEVASFMNKNFFPKGKISEREISLEADRIFADEKFFDVFSYDLILGNKEDLFKSRDNIVISESLAKRLYSSISLSEVIGKTVEWSNPADTTNFHISGIFSDPPANATDQFDAVMHYDLMTKADPSSLRWLSTPGITHLILKEGTDIEGFSKKISSFLYEKDEKWEPAKPFIKQYSSKYLYGPYENGVQVGGRNVYVKLFSFIAVFILLIACINFMNLSTAQASRKMREIGVKKALGASRKTMMFQYLSESILMVIVSMIIAMGLVSFLLPNFNDITGKDLVMNMDRSIVLGFLGIGLLTAVLAGSYPAFYLSGFEPVAVLKGKRNSSLSEQWIRKGLVILQFSLSIIFIAGVLVIDNQIQYIQTKNIGYNRENIISFFRPTNDNSEALMSSLRRIPGVVEGSLMARNILVASDLDAGYSWSGEESNREWGFDAPFVGYDVVETLGMKIVEGRSFSEEFNDDASKIIINEAARKMMQLEDPIGKTLKYGMDAERQVIGVVSDFHYGSLHRPVRPLILRFRKEGRNVLIKLTSGTERNAIAQIGDVFKEFYPDVAFNFTFLDEDYQKLYEAENRVAILSKYFALLAIIISCLGLYGLAAFTAERRRKEIGIRKALGQSSRQVSLLLSSEFTKLVLVAIVIGFPIAYMLANDWLSTFAYKIDLNLGYFLLAGFIIMIVALVSVSSQAIHAAHKNPVDALREEL